MRLYIPKTRLYIGKCRVICFIVLYIEYCLFFLFRDTFAKFYRQFGNKLSPVDQRHFSEDPPDHVQPLLVRGRRGL